MYKQPTSFRNQKSHQSVHLPEEQAINASAFSHQSAEEPSPASSQPHTLKATANRREDITNRISSSIINHLSINKSGESHSFSPRLQKNTSIQCRKFKINNTLVTIIRELTQLFQHDRRYASELTTRWVAISNAVTCSGYFDPERRRNTTEVPTCSQSVVLGQAARQSR